MPHKNAYALFLIVLLLVALGRAAVVVRAQAPRPQSDLPFEFFEQDEVTFTWEDAKKGKTIVQVLNNTTTARTLAVTIGPLTAADGSASDGANAVKPSPETVPLGPGSSAPIAVTVAPEIDKPPQGTYAGFLHVAEASTNTAIHIRIAVVVPAEGAEKAMMAGGESPVPLVDTWKVRYVRNCLRMALLDPLCATANDYLPLDIDANKCEALALHPIQPLGYVTHPDGGIAAVTWTWPGQQPPDLQKRWIQLHFAGLDHAGDYSGKIDLLPDDKEKGTVTLTVSVTDFILWPGVVIFLGIVAAMLGQHYLNVRRPILKLREDEASTPALETGAEAFGYKIVDFERLRQAIQTRIDQLQKDHGWGMATLDDAGAEHKGIQESLDKLKERVKQWNSFGTELAALKVALAAATGNAKPAFKAEAAKLLHGVRLAFEYKEKDGPQTEPADETFEAQRCRVEKATTLARSWKGWVGRLTQAEKELKTGNAAQAAVLLPAIAQQARFELARVRTLLWESPDLDALQAGEMEKSLRMAEGLVSGLKAYPTARERERLGITQLEKLPEAELGQLVFPMQWIAYPPSAALPAQPAARLEVLRGILRRSDRWMFFLALIGALYTGLNTLYFPKAFGTALDYAGAFAWGLGTKATLEVIYAAINRMVRVAD